MSRDSNGGARAGAGRRALDGAVGVIRINILVTPAQKKSIAQGRGSVFVRRAIENELRREAEEANHASS